MANSLEADSLRTKQLPPTWPKGLLTFVVIIFILTLGAYFALNYWNQNQISELNLLKSEFQNLRDTFALEDEQKVILFEKKLKNLNTLLTNHIYFSNVLYLLESLTHPQVYYTSLDFALDRNLIELRGTAKNQAILSEAVSGLVNDSQRIKAVAIKDMQTEDKNNKITFSLSVYLQPSVLKYQINDRNQ
ncbi:MAG: hypothetical protein PHF45_01730 [Candidatus Pacebacteria bacterium]|nr:hypothetical protein [Candidatus Paceibacterota bacterium]